MPRPRLAALGLLCLALMSACAPTPSPQAAAPAPTVVPSATAARAAAPTAVPSATPVPTFAAGSTVAGADVSGLTLAKAEALLRERLAAPEGAIPLVAGPLTATLDFQAIDLAFPVDDLLDEARAALAAGRPAAIAPALTFDEDALRAELATIGEGLAAEASVSVITSTGTLTRSFAVAPAQTLDLDAAAGQVRDWVTSFAQTGKPGKPIQLARAAGEAQARVPLARLREELAALAEEVPGVVGVHLIDLESGESIGLNDRTVFAGASTIKVAIMLNLYVNLDKFSQRQSFWLNEMIRYSDNLSANDLLAAAAGGTGTEWAFTGADEMSTMLQDLGLRHTYLYVPYETTDYIKVYKPKFRCGPKGPVGEKPYTEMGACLRAEPASMARLYQMIDQCANGEGVLLEKFERLSPARCQEMLDWLAKNGDKTRMVAGVPKGVRVEHKSGWIEDLNADVGIVRSEGGDYALAVYYYRPLDGKRDYWPDEQMAPVVAAFSHLVYTAYNPEEAP